MSQAREIAEQLEVIREYAKLYPSAHGQIIGQETWRIVLSGESLQWITDAADKLIELEQQQQLGTLLAALEEHNANQARTISNLEFEIRELRERLNGREFG